MATFKALDNSIQKILKECVSLDEQQKKQYNAKLQEVFEVLETEMKKQEDFKALFRQKQYVGSYFENLKIDEPDEFDVDFELVIPPYIGELKVCASTQPGYCQLKLNPPTASTSGSESVKTKVKKWCDDNGFLLRSKVHQWMQGVVDNALREYRSSDKEKTFKIARSYSGPAITLNVENISQANMKFSMDLVPVFVFQEWPTMVHKLHKYKKNTMGDDKRWYAVPKSKDSDRDFRLSFWHQEKQMLSGKNQLKPVLKLMKKLRDDQNWNGIASYYLKTLFLWKNDSDYNWSKSLGELFIEMLKDLKEYLLIKKALPFYWVSDCNLFAQLKEAQKQSMGGFLQKMIADIERNLDKPDHLLKYFKLNDVKRAISSKNIEWDEFKDHVIRGMTKLDVFDEHLSKNTIKLDDFDEHVTRDTIKLDNLDEHVKMETIKLNNLEGYVTRESNKPNNLDGHVAREIIKLDKLDEHLTRDIIKLDDFDEFVIRDTIRKFYIVQKIVPSLQILLPVLKQKINWKHDTTTLRKKLKSMGFIWRKVENKRSLLLERADIVYWRSRCILQLKHIRQSSSEIFYLGEYWIDSNLTCGKCWLKDKVSVKEKGSSSSRLIIGSIGSKKGFISKAQLQLLAITSQGTYHECMKSANFEKWFEETVLPNLPPHSVIVMDNAPCHNRQVDKTPSKYDTKIKMIEWLQRRGISSNDSLRKETLYSLITANKPNQKQYVVDTMAAGRGHTVVRLPPYNCNLSALELAWTKIKHLLKEHKIVEGMSDENLQKLAVDSIRRVTTKDWEEYCRTVQELEEEYWRCDGTMEKAIDDIIISTDTPETSDDEIGEPERGDSDSGSDSGSD